MSLYVIINFVGIFVFLAITFLVSKKKKEINWNPIIRCIILNFVLAWFMVKFPLGQNLVKYTAQGFDWIVNMSYEGIGFAFPSMVHVKQMDWFIAALMPILLIVPLFDILTFIGVLPFIIKWLGKGLGYITGQPKFESFFAIEMMILGNSEALAVSRFQISKMEISRTVTLAMMSMSCITASIVGAYIQMMPANFILTAIPINIVNAIIITNILNPVKVPPSEDTVIKLKDITGNNEKEPFFSFLGDSILNAGRLILIISATVIAFVALAAVIDNILQLVHSDLSLENIVGVIMYPFAWLIGFDSAEAFKMAQFMGTKLITNEFVVMGKVTGHMSNFSPHFSAVLTVFLTSFANFSTIGIIIGALKSILDKEKNNVISKNIGYMFYSGVFVSLMSAAIVGIFVW
jgi:CNT family concentrative nucleoside transporter/purine nucleoside transport protein